MKQKTKMGEVNINYVPTQDNRSKFDLDELKIDEGLKGKQGILWKTKVYTISAMENLDTQDWREKVKEELKDVGLTVFSPYSRPFVNDCPEDQESRKEWRKWREEGNLEKVRERAKICRRNDLRLIDLSDWFIAYIHPTVASYGAGEELATVIRQKKRIFIWIDGGIRKTPFWLTAQFPLDSFYNSLEEIIEEVKKIDTGKIDISKDERWKLLLPQFR